MKNWAEGLSPQDLLLEQPAPHVALIRLNRPDARNALNIAIRREIARTIQHADQSSIIRAVIIAGHAKYFASGGDIKENAALSPVQAMKRSGEKRRLWGSVAGCSKPVIAAVRGYALGGAAELMMLADITIVADDARIGQPEVTIGIMPGSGGTQRLTHAVGKYRAMQLVLTGKSISGKLAAEYGLASEAVPENLVEARAIEIAAAIAANAPLAVSTAKDAVLIAQEGSMKVGLAFENLAFLSLLSSADFKAGAATLSTEERPTFIGM